MSTDARWVATMPEVYATSLVPALFEPFAAGLADRAAAQHPRTVLELAAGTGAATSALVRALPEADITATDLNPAMVALASARVSGATWVQADAQHLMFEDASFDLVASQFGVMFFPDKAAAFAETARVLKPAGTLIFSVWDAVEHSDFTAAMCQSLAAVLGDPPDFIQRVPHGYHDPARIRADLDAAGMRTRSIERVVLRSRAASTRALTDGFCLGTPLRFELEKRAPLPELLPRLADEMSSKLGEDALDGEMAALFVTADPADPH